MGHDFIDVIPIFWKALDHPLHEARRSVALRVPQHLDRHQSRVVVDAGMGEFPTGALAVIL